MTDWTSIDAGLTGPDFYTGDEFHEGLARLREEDPVHLTHDHHNGRTFWSLTRYDDCAAVLDDPILFSNQAGSQLPPKGPKPTPEYLHKIGADVRLTQQDPPFHTQVRRPLNPHFSVPASRRYTDDISAIVNGLLDDVAGQGQIDLVKDVCAPLPVRVILSMLDVPREHWDKLRDLATSIINPTDPERAQGRDARTVQADGFEALNAYMHDDMMKRRACPHEDFGSKLANLEVEGEQLTERWIGWMATTIVAAGLESTRDAGSLGLREFIRNPDQADALRKDPSLVKQAVEEVLRFATPSRNRLRVATADTEIRGQKIKAGDWVVSWLTAANRDPEVFDRPHEFDIMRESKNHLAFGAGTHMCLGRNVSRVELELLFLRFLERFSQATELEPGPQWIAHNNVVAGLTSYPIDLSSADSTSPVTV